MKVPWLDSPVDFPPPAGAPAVPLLVIIRFSTISWDDLIRSFDFGMSFFRPVTEGETVCRAHLSSSTIFQDSAKIHSSH